MRTWMAVVVCVVAFMLGASTAQAQTVINPGTVEFTPSADHDVVIDGAPVVARYELRYMVVGGMSVAALDLGKPTPVGGKISLPFNGSMLPQSPSTKYIAYVASIGPTGEGVSAASNPFMLVGPPASPGTPTLRR